MTFGGGSIFFPREACRAAVGKLQSIAGNGALERCASECKYRDQDGKMGIRKGSPLCPAKVPERSRNIGTLHCKKGVDGWHLITKNLVRMDIWTVKGNQPTR